MAVPPRPTAPATPAIPPPPTLVPRNYPGTAIPASRFGVNRHTGKMIWGWDHCLQSIQVIFTTAFNERVMRLTFGSNIPSLLDAPANPFVLMAWYSALVSALTAWEPGFRIIEMALVGAGPDGHFTFNIAGIFYPRGHLGDFSISMPKSATVPVVI